VLDVQDLLDGLYPVAETSLKGLRLEPIKDPFEGIMRRDTVGQFEEAFEPSAALAAKELDFLPILGAGNDRTQGDHNDVLQVV
jgi:hypothetical protein